ncbi:FG-GAP repeat domain-containing protein [Streptomyces sp. NPDC001744]|uniref:FG-GAP repeat domain-containing protein n=1 Tax=Streptomyces sp. NPDC001744 TaxID=3364606 RepID=UPI0036CBB9E1
MFFLDSGRARRVAACTALALSAGMLLAGPASADLPAPRPVLRKPAGPALRAPAPVPPPVPAGTGGRIAGASAAGTPPRFDFDADGRSDLVFRDYNGQLRIVQLTSPASQELLRSGGDMSFVKDVITIGDQDAAGGSPELLTLSSDGKLVMYTNIYGSQMGEPSPWNGGGWQIYNKVLSPGDLSGDGRADLLARTPAGELWVYVATGVPTAPFEARRKIGDGWQAYDQLVGLGDSDGDGRGDLVARTPSGDLFYYGSTDSPSSLKPRVKTGYGWQAYTQIVGADDANGDGIGDVYARDANGTLWAYAGTGGGHFAPRTQSSPVGAWGAGIAQIGSAGNVPAQGKEGFAARDKAGTLFWYKTQETGIPAPRKRISDTGEVGGLTLFEANSLDGDGISDTLEIYQNHLYGPNSDFGSGWSVYNHLVGPGDLNGDGRGDLLARDGAGDLYLYRSNVYGTAFGPRLRIGGGWGAYDRIVGSGDYTGDGLNDLVARDGSGTLWLYRGTGRADQVFKPRTQVGTGWNAYTRLVAPGDLTGDGKGDLLGAAPNGDLFLYKATGEAAQPFKARVRVGYGYQIYNALY